MKPSSAIALVSTMLGAATPLATSFFSAWAIGSSFLPQPATSIVAAMRSAAQFRNFDGAVLMFALLQEGKGNAAGVSARGEATTVNYTILDARLFPVSDRFGG